MSRRTFIRPFEEATGMSPGDVADFCAGSAGLRAAFVESKNHRALR
jgi:hypothetical protein